MEISPGLVERQQQIAEEKAAISRLKCSTCGTYPNRTNRGGRYVGDHFYCRRHAELVSGAAARLAALWVTLKGEGMNGLEAGQTT